MIIRRRTLRLALHQKSTTVTVGGSPASEPLSFVPLASRKADVESAEIYELEAPAEPLAGNWLRRLLSSSRNTRSMLLLLLVLPTSLHAQQGCFHSPEAPADVLLPVGSLGLFAGASIFARLGRRW